MKVHGGSEEAPSGPTPTERGLQAFDHPAEETLRRNGQKTEGKKRELRERGRWEKSWKGCGDGKRMERERWSK